ncbi:PGPGW domain-containing protein [Candidatus Woesearchaeota archaeon]|nr:PGPGW domain-containing protein [Candidatus Woesearchaeota archaeon]
MINNVLRHTKKLIVLVIGGSVLLFGIILVFIPGPAIIIIPLGLAILATEFVWARVLLKHVKEKAKNAHKIIVGRKK